MKNKTLGLLEELTKGSIDKKVGDMDIQHYSIGMVEFAIINNFLFKTLGEEIEGITTLQYGEIDPDMRVMRYNGVISDIKPFWFRVYYRKYEMEFLFQTKQYVNNYNEINHSLYISSLGKLGSETFTELFDDFKKISFNNSKYKNKSLKITVNEKCFNNIEIIDTTDFDQNIILTEIQSKFIGHYINRVKRGGNCRYLLNGVPGSGKTETIRKIMHNLEGHATTIIPEFSTSYDLISILDACTIFDNAIIVIDDIDLFLGNRDNGSYTKILGDFLSFFDGVKKNDLSIIASTNDKDLVDKAAERPGRFNMTIDYGYLTNEQVIDVCKIHFDEKWLIEDVFNSLTGTDSRGNPIKITGAFIANLASNLKEMSKDDDNWGIDDTILLIKETYDGFYHSQINIKNKKIGF